MGLNYREERVSGGLGRCILPMLDTLGWKGGKRSFLNALPYDYRNFDVHDLVNTMSNLGFRVNASRGTVDKLDTRLLPCLFVDRGLEPRVLINYENGRFFCFNGEASGFETISLSGKSGDFYCFENIAEMPGNPEKEQKEWFSTFFTRFRKPMLTAFFISLLLTLSTMASPFIVMGIYSRINSAETLNGFWIIGAGILGILLVDLMFRLLRHGILAFMGARMGFLVSTQVFKRILSFSPSATENASVGSQIVRIRDFNSVRAFIEGPGMTSVMDLPFLIVLMVGLVVMAGYLAFIPLVAVVVLLMFSFCVLPFVRKNNSLSADSGSKKQAYLIEFFSEFREIRMSGLSRKWIEKFDKISSNAAMDNLKTSNINSVINHISQAIVSISGALTITFCVFGVLDGRFSGAILIAAMMLVWKILSPISSGFTVFSQAIRIKKSLLQLNRLMTMKLEPSDDNIPPAHFNGRIVFKRVSLRYKPDYYPALIGINLAVDKGELVLLKGHDGGGKSTLLKLIIGMYKAQAGTITLDGINIQQLPPALLRKSIAYLPQDDVLFNVSIRKNLKYYSPTSSARDMADVIEKLGLNEEIDSFPEKLDTPVSMLSSASDLVSFRKRVCIARTLLNEADILLLDEPDRGLGKQHVEMLAGILKEMKQTKTILIASNHPELEGPADKVALFNIGTLTCLDPTERND